MRIFRAARFLFALGLRVDAVRLTRATVLAVVLYVAAPLAALALRDLTDDLLAHRAGPALAAALLASAALVAQIMLGHFCHLDLVRVTEGAQMRLRGELMELVNGPSRIDHLDRPDVADTVELVRDGLLATTQSLESVLQLTGLLLQMIITLALLVMVSPLCALLPLCAVVPVLLERTAQSTVEDARERTAERFRLAKHLLEVATSAGPVRELRLFGAGDEIGRRQRDAWGEVTTVMWRAQLKAAAYRAVGQGFFALGYAGAIAGELYRALHGDASPGDLILVITLAVQVSVQVAGALSALSLVQAAGRTIDRMGELQRVGDVVSPVSAAAAAVPVRLRRGITLEDVSFSYPGAERPVLSGVWLDIPAGSVLALVGENGAGKSTLVKLLCGLYRPTSGRILIDGQDLAGLDPARWRARVAALFQDFHRIELTLGMSIGHGDIARADDTEAIGAAAGRARADGLLRAVRGGLNGYLGHSYADGTELSGGQWQTVGLARTLMRRQPLLLILDEPAAALDPSAEHDLFERYASSAAQAGREDGGVTVLISHRFSTVRMADLIAVLDRGRLTEYGTHRQLMTAGGLYAELFTLQARAYAWPTVGKVPPMSSLLAPDASLERLYTGTEWGEGPVWLPGDRALRWSDIPNNRIMQYHADDGRTVVYREDVEFTNGRTLDRDGAVVQCSHGRRAVERESGGRVTVLVDRWQGKRLNSPNDVVVAADGSIWFSDPPYGIISDREGRIADPEYDGCYVFRLDERSGELTPMVTDMVHPNGLAFSPDERMLYVSDSSPELRHIRAYDVVDGACVNGRLFAEVHEGWPDGFRIDEAGRLWSSSGDGVLVFAPDGELILQVPVPEKIGNLCFGGPDGHDLYIAASSSLYRIKTTTRNTPGPGRFLIET